MYDRILCPTDGSDAAEAALDVALDVADAHDAVLHVLFVADTNQPSLARIQNEVRDVLEDEGADVVEAAADRARRRGIETVDAVVQGGPSRTIREYADERDVDLVVMGTRGERDVERLVLGSVTQRVVRDAAVPVLVVPPESGGRYPPANAVVGTDGSDGAAAAVDSSAGVAAAADATLHVVTVVESTLLGFDVRSLSAAEERERRGEGLLADAAERAREAGASAVETVVEEGDVVEALTEYADEHGADLIAVGTHGRTGIDRRLLGSVTEDLLRRTSVPVLSVRAADDD